MFSLSAPVLKCPQSSVELNGTPLPAYHSMVLIERAEVIYLRATIQPISCMFGPKPLRLGPKVEC